MFLCSCIILRMLMLPAITIDRFCIMSTAFLTWCQIITFVVFRDISNITACACRGHTSALSLIRLFREDCTATLAPTGGQITQKIRRSEMCCCLLASVWTAFYDSFETLMIGWIIKWKIGGTQIASVSGYSHVLNLSICLSKWKKKYITQGTRESWGLPVRHTKIWFIQDVSFDVCAVINLWSKIA